VQTFYAGHVRQFPQEIPKREEHPEDQSFLLVEGISDRPKRSIPLPIV
jgi:hypothetical protein